MRIGSTETKAAVEIAKNSGAQLGNHVNNSLKVNRNDEVKRKHRENVVKQPRG